MITDLNIIYTNLSDLKIENLLETVKNSFYEEFTDIFKKVNSNKQAVAIPYNLTEEDMEEISEIYIIDSGINRFLKYLVIEYDGGEYECTCEEYTELGNDNCEHIIIAKNKPISFRINDYIEMRYEDGNSMLYVGGKRFRKCIYLLLNIDTSNQQQMKEQEEIDSIDEAEDKFSQAMHGRKAVEFTIDPLEEFWGHCSNLQAWVEYDYDTRVLHRSLAFPLLKELVKLGDPKAKRYYKDDILYRIQSGHRGTIEYMKIEGWLSKEFFTHEELQMINEEIQKALNNR